VGPTVSVKEREEGIPVRVLKLLGCGLVLVLGRNVSPGRFSILSFLFHFPFSVLFCNFAKQFPN
jgi:hypothetical protein